MLCKKDIHIDRSFMTKYIQNLSIMLLTHFVTLAITFQVKVHFLHTQLPLAKDYCTYLVTFKALPFLLLQFLVAPVVLIHYSMWANNRLWNVLQLQSNFHTFFIFILLKTQLKCPNLITATCSAYWLIGYIKYIVLFHLIAQPHC